MVYKLHLPYFDEKWLKMILIDDKRSKNDLKPCETMINCFKNGFKRCWTSRNGVGRCGTVKDGEGRE